MLPQIYLNTKGHYKQRKQGCPLMSRWEDSPQVHKLPHSGNLPHLKRHQTLSPTGKLLISSLFANAEIKVCDLCYSTKKTSGFPPPPQHRHTDEVNFKRLWHGAIGYHLPVTSLLVRAMMSTSTGIQETTTWQKATAPIPSPAKPPQDWGMEAVPQGAANEAQDQLPPTPHWTVWTWVMAAV